MCEKQNKTQKRLLKQEKSEMSCNRIKPQFERIAHTEAM